ncbi:MAG: hypothetical protein AB2689_21665 [Candidatus Thiodiazotropha taylori]
MPSIDVTLLNNSSFDRTFEIVDAVCDNEDTISFQSWEKISYTICSSGAHDSGYGTIQYRVQGNSGWSESTLITDGEEVTLY